MALALGLNAWLAFGEEVTYGTAVARTKWLEITDESVALKQTLISKPALRQVSISNRVQSKKSVDGSFKWQMGYEGSEKILKHAMGTVAAVSGAGPYVHAFTLASAMQTGLTLEINRDSAAIGGSTAFIYEGCQINKLTLSQDAEDFLMCEAQVIGEDMALGALTSQSFTTFNGISWAHFTLTISAASVNVKSFELSIENSLASDRYKLGSRIRKGLGRQSARKISGKIVLEFETITEYNYFQSTQTTLRPIVATWDNGLGGINQKTLLITLPACAFQGSDPKVGDQGPIEVELPFDAFQSAANNDEMTASLTGNLNVSQ